MAKQTSAQSNLRKPKIKRSGVHAKTRNSGLKSSKNYKKSYARQGR
jgi:hypothetical protein